MAFKKWREKGESFRVDRYRCIQKKLDGQNFFEAPVKPRRG
jgi:hypothetical protein